MSTHVLVSPAGYASREVGLFVAQMDDQSRRLAEDTRGITPAELAWQPGPGMNTIGMLLAHIAIVEVYWILIATRAANVEDSRPAIGIGVEDDGMPMPEHGAPPATLAGKSIEYFDDLLARARAHTCEALRPLADAELDREVERRSRAGKVTKHSVRWILYHVIEHLASHYGQVNLLRHQYRAAVGAKAGA